VPGGGKSRNQTENLKSTFKLSIQSFIPDSSVAYDLLRLLNISASLRV